MYTGLTRCDRLLPVTMHITRWCMVCFVALLFLLPVTDASGSRTSEHTQSRQLGLRLALLNTLAKHATHDYQIDTSNHCGINPANNITACFTRQGLELATRDHQVRLTLSAWGRSDSLKNVQAVTPTITGGKVEYARDGITEWYLNVPQGIEQGFTIDSAPSGDGGLIIKLKSSMAFVSGQNRLSWGNLDYSGLFAIDSTGRELPARLRSQGHEIILIIDDQDAVYPVIVDPLIHEQKLTTSGTENDWFGYSVALSGDGNRALIGARKADVSGATEQGAAYVFVRNAGVWSEEEVLTGSDSVAGDHFGSAVALSFDGSVAVVGAFWAHVNFSANQGAAYVFTRSGSNWFEEDKLTTPPTGIANDEFGTVAISGDGTTVLVGARKADVAGSNNQGAAYIFTEAFGTWSVEQALVAVDAASSDNFGASTALSFDGNTALVGAPQEGIIPADGVAYIFSRNAGVWAQQDKLTAFDGAAGDRFGAASSLSDDGSTALIGAWGSSSFQGTAYVFVLSGLSWPTEQKLTASDGAVNDWFGNATALSADGNIAIIAAPLANIGSNASQGAVYRYTRTAGSWSEREKLVAVDGTADEAFGLEGATALSDDGATALVGVKKARIGGNAEQGAAYVMISTPIAVTDLIPPTNDLLIDFGNVTSLTTADQEVTVTNDGIVDFTLGDIAISNPLPVQFSILDDLCSTFTLNPQGSCTFTVRFLPDSIASFNDDFDVPSTDPLILPVTVSVVGAGTAPIPDITVLDTVDFGGIPALGTVDQIISITNDGNGDLTIGNIGLADPLLAPFSIPVAPIDGCSTITLAPSTSCQFTTRFSPTMTGTFPDTFDIPSDDPDENPISVSVTGTGLPIPDITVTDSIFPANDLELIFGDVTELAFEEQIVTITNTGDANLVIEQIGQANMLTAPFSIVVDGCSAQSISPAASCTLTIRFAPVVANTFSNSFDIPSNDPDEASVIFSVNGTGIPLPANIVLTDSVLPADDRVISFGTITELTSSDHTVTITNSGNTDLTIGQIAQADTLVTPFAIQSDNCSGNVITPIGNCSLTVRFSPAADGNFNDSFDIPSDDPDNNLITFTLNGTGTATLIPEITVTDSVPPINDLQLPFGNVTENNASAKTITVSNDGTENLAINQIQLTGNLLSVFSIDSDTCSNTSLSPATNCLVTIQFSPASSGSFGATLEVPSDDLDEGIVMIGLNGTGTAMLVANIAVTDSVKPAADLSIDFGTITQFTSASQSISIVNNGNADLILGPIGMVDLLIAPFSIPGENDDCSGQTLAPAENCVLAIAFEPATDGPFTDTLDIPSNDPDEPSIIIAVTGTGTSVPVPAIAVTDAIAPTTDLQLPFGAVTENTLVNQVITISNSGEANLIIGQIARNNALTGPFSIQNDNCSEQTVMPSEDCTVTVRFAPTSAGNFSDSFDISSTDPDEDTLTFSVNGAGISTGNGNENNNNDSGGGGGSLDTVIILILLILTVLHSRTGRRQWIRQPVGRSSRP